MIWRVLSAPNRAHPCCRNSAIAGQEAFHLVEAQLRLPLNIQFCLLGRSWRFGDDALVGACASSHLTVSIGLPGGGPFPTLRIRSGYRGRGPLSGLFRGLGEIRVELVARQGPLRGG